MKSNYYALNKKYFSGIGSRETPPEILALMVEVGKFLALKGYVLRSGGANGADKAFEQGCDQAQGQKEIYLPWKGFNDNPSELHLKSPALNKIKDKAFELASHYHPAWDQLNYGARCLMARNGMQVLGQDLNTPVEFVICWNLGGFSHGGTSQALRIAQDWKIPIFMLSKKECEEDVRAHLSRGLDLLKPLTLSLFEE
jgi:hypothetical protein